MTGPAPTKVMLLLGAVADELDADGWPDLASEARKLAVQGLGLPEARARMRLAAEGEGACPPLDRLGPWSPPVPGWFVTVEDPADPSRGPFDVYAKAASQIEAVTSALGRYPMTELVVVQARRQTPAEAMEAAAFQAGLDERERLRAAHAEALPLRRFGRRELESWSPVATEVWAMTLDAEGEETGYCARVRGRTLGEVAEDLRAAFRALDEYEDPDDPPESRAARAEARRASGDPARSFDAEGFGVCSWTELDGRRGCDAEWPAHVRWLAAYAVTGGSEGHYVHVDAQLDRHPDGRGLGAGDPPPGVQLFLCKTFRGRADAYRIAEKFAELLGA